VAGALHNPKGLATDLPGRGFKVNCAALPAVVIESELVRTTREGGLSRAPADTPGLVDSARSRGHTLFLDEIGDLPLGKLQPNAGSMLLQWRGARFRSGSAASPHDFRWGRGGGDWNRRDKTGDLEEGPFTRR